MYDELQSVDGLDVVEEFLEAAGVDELLEALAGPETEMVLAGGADLESFLDDFFEEHGREQSGQRSPAAWNKALGWRDIEPESGVWDILGLLAYILWRKSAMAAR